MRRLSPLWLLASAAAPGALAGGKAFSIHDDVLAYPQVWYITLISLLAPPTKD